jgi:hypothetical protein
MKILRGTVFGGIAYFFLGWLIYGILLMDLYSANMNQCANKPAGDMAWWAIIASNLVVALFLTLFLKWSGAKSISGGLKTGALFGALYSLSIGLSFWSMTTMYLNFGFLVLDVIITTAVFAVLGLIIVLLWGREKE